MPALITLNTDYATPGQTDYATKMDSDNTALNTFILETVTELRSTNTTNSIIGQEILKDPLIGEGRFTPNTGRITFVVGQTQITVSSGRVFFAGQRVTIVGSVLTGFSSSSTRFIAASLDGILSVESSPNQQAFDIATINQAGATLQAGEVIDNLAGPSGRLLNSASVVNRIVHREDPEGNVIGVGDPAIRAKSVLDLDEDAGFFHTGTPSRIGLASQRSTSEGVGVPIQSHEWTEKGQVHAFEQTRCIATAAANDAGINGTLTAVLFDNEIRQEPDSYLTGPWFVSPGALFTKPTGDEYDGTYIFSGFVAFPVGATGPFECDILADGVSVARAKGEKASTGETILSLSGIGEMAGAATVELRAATADGVAQTIDARIGFYLMGGRITP